MQHELKRNPFSISFRLVSLISLTTIVAFLIFTFIMVQTVEKHFEQIDFRVMDKIQSSMIDILGKKNIELEEKISLVNSLMSGIENGYVSLENSDGEIVLSSKNNTDYFYAIKQTLAEYKRDLTQVQRLTLRNVELPTPNAKDKLTDSFRITISPITFTIHGEQVDYRLTTIMSTSLHAYYLDKLKLSSTVLATFTCIISIIIVLITVYKAHAPLRIISKQINGITSANLNERIDPDYVPSELKQLAYSFNEMLCKIEDVFKRQSNFSSDIAHEMRTPITNLVTQSQYTLSRPRSNEEYRELIYSNLEEYERMAKMVNDMLFLSQTEDTHLLNGNIESFLPQEQMKKVINYFEFLAEDKGIPLKLWGESCHVDGNPAMFKRAIGNLISNAIRYTPEGQSITIAIYEHSTKVDIHIINQGKPIPEEHLSHLFERFYRVDESRCRVSEGSGIGLAIVKSIALAHKGNVKVISNERVTVFTLTLPKPSKK